MGRTPRVPSVTLVSPRRQASSFSPRRSPRGTPAAQESGRAQEQPPERAPAPPRDCCRAPVPPLCEGQLDVLCRRAAPRRGRAPTDGMLGGDSDAALSFRSQLAQFQQYLQETELLEAGGSDGPPNTRPGRRGQAPASLPGQLEQALAQHTAALQRAAAEHEGQLQLAAERIGQELGRAVGAALLRGQSAAASSARSAPSTARAGRSATPRPRRAQGAGSAGQAGGAAASGPSGCEPLGEPSPPSSASPRSSLSECAAASWPVGDVDPAGSASCGVGGVRRAGGHGESDLVDRIPTKESRVTAVSSWSERGPQSTGGRLIKGVTVWLDAEEPHHSGLVAGMIQSRAFDILCNLVILLNCIFVVWMANRSVGSSRDRDAITVVEFVFTTFYSLEIGLKLWVHRLFFFSNEDAAFNVLDLSLVLIAGFEIVILPLIRTSSGAVDSTFLRILRVFKVVKVLRMMRALHAFKDIRVMIDCLVHSVWPLLWASALLGFLSSLFAIYFVQSLAVALEDGNLSPAQERELLEHFGQVEVAVFSLLVATTGGNDWAYYSIRLEPLGGFACVVYVVYIMFMFLAVMNIVTSVFLDKAMEIAKPCSENERLDQCHADLEDARELTRLVSSMDEAHQDRVTFGQFVGYMREPEFRKHFDARGLTRKDTRMLFKMLASYDSGPARQRGERTVHLSAFLEGCMRLKGEASSMDVYALGCGLHLVRAAQADFGAWAEGQFAELGARLDGAAAPARASGHRPPGC
ncbi:unnamed protein product [Prorocentrum cordatum]|uniref:Ion transport domain-containing protein n=1 Tax=Prorocentrum cordatum TaxID=2364126 RepID=A0ABN9SLW1_9DINO|nr:unnamed protein product [Polarella glacialis]